MRNCFVFDIDGTLADATHRLHHIKKQPKDWESFFSGQAHDAPILHMVIVHDALHELGVPVIYASGRPDNWRETTEQWLIENTADRGMARQIVLYMRKAGDHRDDDIIKLELLAEMRADGWNPIMVFDDRKRVVDAWRSAGVPCAQVAEGNF